MKCITPVARGLAITALAIALLHVSSSPAAGPTPTPRPTPATRTLLILPFDMVDTSVQAEMNHGPLKSDLARLRRTQAIVRKAVADRPEFKVIPNASVKQAIDDAQHTFRYLYECNGCDVDIGRKAGADLVMTGWLQKVSNLILNINAQIYDVATGRQMAIGSVSMRGDTDESWRDAALYLINHPLIENYHTVSAQLQARHKKPQNHMKN